jgi:hypothetical protein
MILGNSQNSSPLPPALWPKASLEKFPADHGSFAPGRAALSVKSQLRLAYLCSFSKPPEDRPIYKAICEACPTRILEIGIGSGQRALRMIEVAALCRPAAQIRYTGIDLFEARSAGDGPGLSLIQAHRALKTTGALIRLIPGDLCTALARSANSLPGNDLIVIAGRRDPEAMRRAWFFLPRMLKADSQLFVQEGGEDGSWGAFRRLTFAEVDQLGGTIRLGRAA